MNHLLSVLFFFFPSDPFVVEEVIYMPVTVKVTEQNRIVVIDQAESAVLCFLPNGKLAFKFGRSGQGPGEFGNPTDVGVFPDGRLMVVDGANRRLQWFSPSGKYEKMVKIQDHALGQVLVLGEERFILTESNGWSFSITMGEEERERKRFHLYDGEGRHLKSFGEFVHHKNPLLAVRLNQGPLASRGASFLFASSCSNELIWYENGGERKFKYPLPFIPDEPVEKLKRSGQGGEEVFAMAVKADFVCLGMDLMSNGDILILRTRDHTSPEEGLPPTNLIRLSPKGEVRKKYEGEFQSKGIAVSNDDRFVYILLEEEHGGLRRITL